MAIISHSSDTTTEPSIKPCDTRPSQGNPAHYICKLHMPQADDQIRACRFHKRYTIFLCETVKFEGLADMEIDCYALISSILSTNKYCRKCKIKLYCVVPSHSVPYLPTNAKDYILYKVYCYRIGGSEICICSA